MSSASTGRPESAPDHTVDDYVPSIDAAEPNEPQTSGRDAPTQDQDPTKPRFRGLARWKSTRRSQSIPKGKSLEIFERVVRQQVEQEDVPTESAPGSPAALQFYNDLAQLKSMLRWQSIESCLEFFLTRVWNNVPFEGRNRLLKQRGTYLMTRVVQAKMDDWDNEKLPSLAQTAQIFRELDSLSCKKWADSIMSLIRNLVTRSTAKADYPDAEAYERSMARKDVLLQDLIDTWVVFHRHRLSPHRNDDLESQEWSLRFPRLDQVLLREYARRGEAIKAINMMFPQIWGNDFKSIPVVAIASFVVLADPAHSSLGAQEKAKPLLDTLGKILAVVPIWKTGLQSIFAEHPDVLAYVLARWDSLISQLRQTDRPKHKPENIFSKPEVNPETNTEAKAEVKRRGGPGSNIIMHQVNTALGMGDADAVEAAWARFWDTEAVLDEDRKAELQTMDKLFHYFILAFTALHRPQRAVEVWDCMTRIGVEPTIKTWTSLIEGCRRSKNAVGIENVWRKLLASGLEVDEEAWSARVVGLMDCGEPEAGLRALDEMLHQSKLTIAPINAAVAALIRLNAMSAARKVLDWASQNHIEPNIMTFNTLLRPLVVQGNAAQVDSLLKMMKEKGVEPDEATFTVLLEGLIGGSKDADPAEQVKSINDLFDQMTAAGVQANMQTFARMIYLLLSEPGANNYEAVEAIRGHIHNRGLTMSPQMHTILVDHYFSLDPPNLAAVEDLMNKGGLKWKMLVKRGLDRVFWERVIKGYAKAGDVDKAYEIFEQVDNIGSVLTLDTLSTLLRSLVKEGKREEAKKTVELVKRHRQNFQASQTGAMEGPNLIRQKQRGRYWRHRFWAYAVEHGLLSPAEWKELEMGVIPQTAAT